MGHDEKKSLGKAKMDQAETAGKWSQEKGELSKVQRSLAKSAGCTGSRWDQIR